MFWKRKQKTEEELNAAARMLFLSHRLLTLSEAEAHRRWEQKKIDALVQQAKGLGKVAYSRDASRGNGPGSLALFYCCGRIVGDGENPLTWLVGFVLLRVVVGLEA
jgi:hypothetical protein